MKNFLVKNFGLKSNHGFTLIELLLVVVLIGAVSMISIPAYISFQTRNDIDIAATTFAQGSRRAATLARSQEANSRWGIKFVPGSIVIFKGDSYIARDSSLDENYDISPTITFSGQDEFTYNQFTGYPVGAGSLTINNQNGEQRQISINEKGTVDY